MLKNKGARAIGKHPFQHSFWCHGWKANEAVFISRFSIAIFNYNYFIFFFLQNVYQCLISVRIIQNNRRNKNALIVSINTGI